MHVIRKVSGGLKSLEVWLSKAVNIIYSTIFSLQTQLTKLRLAVFGNSRRSLAAKQIHDNWRGFPILAVKDSIQTGLRALNIRIQKIFILEDEVQDPNSDGRLHLKDAVESLTSSR